MGSFNDYLGRLKDTPEYSCAKMAQAVAEVVENNAQKMRRDGEADE